MSKIYVDEIAGIASADTVAIPGHVIQVVHDTSTAFDSTASTSFIDTSLSGTITPTSASSRILVSITTNISASNNGGSVTIALNRGATELIQIAGAYSTAGGIYCPFAYNFEDSPNTTSAVTYTVRFKSQSASTSVLFNSEFLTATGETATITLMEIAG